MTAEQVALQAAIFAEKHVDGRCGDKCQAFVDFMRGLGFECRQWGFMFEGDGPETHVGAEVRWDDRWHYFDVHWRAHWGTYASLEDVLNPRMIVPLYRDHDWIAAHPELRDGRDPFAYLSRFTRKWVLYFENAETGERWDA